MKKLIITANSNPKAFTHKLSEKYTSLSKEKGDDIDILDLYRTELKQDFLNFDGEKTSCNYETIKKIQEKILWADELIFIFPIWWGDMPAIMKNFWDINFMTGFAFKYENGKAIGLLKGKTARVIATSGAPSFFYKIILHIQLIWNMNRIGFCGMKQKSFTVFGDMDSSKTDKNKYLDKIKNLI